MSRRTLHDRFPASSQPQSSRADIAWSMVVSSLQLSLSRGLLRMRRPITITLSGHYASCGSSKSFGVMIWVLAALSIRGSGGGGREGAGSRRLRRVVAI